MHKELTKAWPEKKTVYMGEGRERGEAGDRRKKGRGHVMEVRIRGEQRCLMFTCFSLFPLALS